MMRLADLLEKLQALPRYALDHPVLLQIDDTLSADGNIYVVTSSDGVILHQSQQDCAGFPRQGEADQ